MIDYPPATAFTRKYTGRINVLKTPCGVSTAYDPQKGGVPPNVINCEGLWDTGATGTVISKECAQKLGLRPIGKAQVFHANGKCTVNVYMVNVYLPNKVAIPMVRVTEGVLNGTDLLIGMDIITLGDFSVTNGNGMTTFSFSVPAKHNIDYTKINQGEISSMPISQNGKPPKAINGQKQVPQRQTSPNRANVKRTDPCPCGSGKRFKNCCANKPKEASADVKH